MAIQYRLYVEDQPYSFDSILNHIKRKKENAIFHHVDWNRYEAYYEGVMIGVGDTKEEAVRCLEATHKDRTEWLARTSARRSQN